MKRFFEYRLVLQFYAREHAVVGAAQGLVLRYFVILEKIKKFYQEKLFVWPSEKTV